MWSRTLLPTVLRWRTTSTDAGSPGEIRDETLKRLDPAG